MKLVQVEWVDSSQRVGWQELDQVYHTDPCVSVGWLYRVTRDLIVLVPHKVIDEKSGVGILTIPRVAVTAVKSLVPGKRVRLS
jgi:hypothetical protein